MLLPAINLITLNDLPRASRGPRARVAFGLSARGYAELAALGIRGVQEQIGVPIAHRLAARHSMERYGAAIVTESNVGAKAEKWKNAGCVAATILIGTGYEEMDQASRKIEAVLEASSRSGLPIHVETHRGTVTQDLALTRDLCARFPELTLNADLSHYVTGHRLLEQPAEVIDALDPILERVRFIHARLSNDVRAQLQNGAGSAFEALFVELWTRIFEHFIRRAEPGATLPFAPELLPSMTGYAHLDSARPGHPELGDRFEEALRLLELGRGCYSEARAREDGESARAPLVTVAAKSGEPNLLIARRPEELDAAPPPEGARVRLRVGDAMGAPDAELDRWAAAIAAYIRRAPCPVHIDTRRGTLAGSIGGATRLLERCPALSLDLDLPEWMLAHEVMPHTQANADRALLPLLARVGRLRLDPATGEHRDASPAPSGLGMAANIERLSLRWMRKTEARIRLGPPTG